MKDWSTFLRVLLKEKSKNLLNQARTWNVQYACVCVYAPEITNNWWRDFDAI